MLNKCAYKAMDCTGKLKLFVMEGWISRRFAGVLASKNQNSTELQNK
jgi:hypothetical protein